VRPGIRSLVLEPFYQEVDTDPINSVLHVWQRGWLPEDSLLRSDRTAAHNGLEVRTPLLDPSFVRTCNSLPGTVKVVPQGTGFQTKWPLRLAMQDRLPDAVLRRPKRSLPNPLGRWLRGDGRGFLDDAVDAIQRDAAALFAPQHVARLRDEHVAGRADHGLKLWTLVLFSVWRRQVGA
jgi:asparagine synthase (glutamine-hydrolysing)